MHTRKHHRPIGSFVQPIECIHWSIMKPLVWIPDVCVAVRVWILVFSQWNCPQQAHKPTATPVNDLTVEITQSSVVQVVRNALSYHIQIPTLILIPVVCFWRFVQTCFYNQFCLRKAQTTCNIVMDVLKRLHMITNGFTQAQRFVLLIYIERKKTSLTIQT